MTLFAGKLSRYSGSISYPTVRYVCTVTECSLVCSLVCLYVCVCIFCMFDYIFVIFYCVLWLF